MEFEKHYHNLQGVFQELCDSNNLTDQQIERINQSLSGLVEFYNSLQNPDINAAITELPFQSKEFLQAWEEWKQYKKEQHKFVYKSIAEKSALKKLVERSNNNELDAIKIIEDSISNGWKGLFKENQHATITNTKNTQQPVERYKVEKKSYQGRD